MNLRSSPHMIHWYNQCNSYRGSRYRRDLNRWFWRKNQTRQYVVQHSRAMAYLRGILNHTFLRTLFYTNSRKAELEYQEVQRNFINDHSNNDPDDESTKFTALDIINYIESDCICSNNKVLQSIHNSISKMVRYNNQTLLDWLQSFAPPLNKFLKAASQQTLDNEKLKTLWKTISSIR